jgi:hypothetical protein
MRTTRVAVTIVAAALSLAASTAEDHKVPPNFNLVGQVASSAGTAGTAVAVDAYGPKQKVWIP